MSRNKHRAALGQSQPRDASPTAKALEQTPHDLDDLARLWPQALEQLDLRADAAPRLVEMTAEFLAGREERDRAERDERVLNARKGIEPLGASPSPLQVAALDDLATAQAGLLQLGDELTVHVRRGRPVRNDMDARVGPHRLIRIRAASSLPAPTKRAIDHLGYPLRFGYGMRVYAGRDIEPVGTRRDRDPTLSAIVWIRAALPAVTDLPLAERTATEVRRIRGRVRAVIGLADMQVRLAPACFVCGQPSLRMNVDRLYVECRNADCTPTEEQCTFTGPRGEPRWYRAEWRRLSKKLDVNLESHLLQLLEQNQAS